MVDAPRWRPDTAAVYRVLVGSDGSRAALKAASYAASLLRHVPDVQVDVVYVRPGLAASVGPGTQSSSARSALAAGLSEAAQDVLARTSAPFEANGIPVSASVEAGQPGQRLCALAAEHGVDLLVIGSRGHTELKALLLGSVSNQVVHGAPCPVLVVH